MSLPVADLVSLEFRSRGYGRELYSADDNEYRKSDEFPEVVEEVPSPDNGDGDIASAFNEEFSRRGFSKTQLSTDDEHAAAVPPPEKYLSPLDAAALMGAGVLLAKEVAQSFKTPSYRKPGQQNEFKSLAGPSKNYGAEGDDDEEECDECHDDDATFHGQLGLPGGPEQYSWSESKVSRNKDGKFRKKGYGNSANRKTKSLSKTAVKERSTAQGATELSSNEKVILEALSSGPMTIAELAATTQMSDHPNSPLFSSLSSLRDSKRVKSRKVDGEDKFEAA
jgi:hypothetical protein